MTDEQLVGQKKIETIQHRFIAEGCDVAINPHGEPFITLFNQTAGVALSAKLSVMERIVNIHAKEILARVVANELSKGGEG
jgi:hypothetical protein